MEVSFYNGTANEKHLLVRGFSATDNLGRVFAGTLPISQAQSSALNLHQLSTSSIGEIAQLAFYDRYGAQFAVEAVTANATNNGVTYTPMFTNYTWSTTGTYNAHVSIEQLTQAANLGSSANQKSVSYLDTRGQIAAVVEGMNANDLSTTSFGYDKIGQQLQVTDPAGAISSYIYDRLGRVVSENHPDKGATDIEYGISGNLLSTSFDTDNGAQELIAYAYEYNRLTSKSYPVYDDINGLAIEYGRPGDGRNGAGRIVSTVQGTNLHTQEFFYDALGNTIRDQETIAVPLAGEYTLKTDYTYDSWGRVKHMRYPDGEIVSYGYAPAGELESVSSNLNFITHANSDYVSKIGYDGYGSRSYLRYGNGTETDYEYNAVTRQAKRMELYTSENNATGGQIKILDKSYQYNALGMISSIANSAGHLGSSLAYNDLGGTYSFNYTYDDHGRLSSVGNSSWTGSAGTWTYNLSMTYAKDGRILSKDQGFVGPGGTPHATMDYTLSYQYGASADVHQLAKIVEDGFDINVTYNARGGIKHIDNAKTKEHTTHVWDKDMRLRGTKNNGGLHHNVYDWMGTRLMKSTLTTATVYQNGNPTTTHSVMPYIVYAGSHYVFEMYRNDVEVSKHYFAGDERIATRLQVEARVNYSYGSEPTEYTSYFGSYDPDGDGSFNPNPAPASPNNIVLDDLCRMANEVGYSLECYFLKQQLLPQYIYSIGDRDACWGEDEFNAFVFPMDMTAYCECLDPNQPNRSYDCTLYPFIYWYHHDHKGSTEFVTDLAGMAYEYSLYSPFGEGLVSQSANNSGYSNPYKFKGAIYDPETGLTYNVARFYYAKWSIWISPDPLANLRNWVTPYNYTLNNPINRIDPTGLLCKEVKTGPGKTPKGPPQNPCEGDIYINQNGWEFTFYNGKWYSSNIVLDQVIVTPNDSELARINPSLRGNNKSGYIYNKYDLKIREKLLAIRGYNSIVTFMLRMEKDGDYQPLHSLNFYKQYTKKFHSNSSIYFAAVNVPEISEIFLFANPIGAEVSAWRSGARGMATAAKTSTNVYKHSFKYADRVRMRGVQDPVSHNFPYSFDDAILATKPIPKNNGYQMFQLNGTMNGKNGVFEIGLTKDGIIDHRFFRPIK
jgi:RHS repeat-associated protein